MERLNPETQMKVAQEYWSGSNRVSVGKLDTANSGNGTVVNCIKDGNEPYSFTWKATTFVISWEALS
jgi:hypothetical protein